MPGISEVEFAARDAQGFPVVPRLEGFGPVVDEDGEGGAAAPDRVVEGVERHEKTSPLGGRPVGWPREGVLGGVPDAYTVGTYFPAPVDLEGNLGLPVVKI